MTPTSKTILFFGTEDFSGASLEALISENYSIGAVITKPDSKKGRGQKLIPSRVKVIAQAHNIPVWQPQKLADIADNIASFDKPVGVLVSFGKIIPKSIIDLFDPGIINVHPSLLPTYRGPSPIESAIINGDTKTGVTIMQLSPKMDAGPLYDQVTIDLNGDENQPELYDTLAHIGADLLIASLPGIIMGDTLPVAQNEDQVSYCALLTKNDTLIDPQSLTAEHIERRIRAYQNYPKTRLPFYGSDLIITSAHTAQQPDETTLLCKDGSYLAIDELQSQNGKKMTAQAYLRGIH